MTVAVKICGIKTPAALDGALEAGADLFGLVFYPPSPRYLTPESARRLVERAAGRAKSVALLVDPDDELLREVMTLVDPDLVQLHGSEPPERVAAIRLMFGRPVIKAIKVADESDAEAALAFEQADYVLFDAKPPKGVDNPLPGGNGFAFDWRVIRGVTHRGDYILSGGLDADNVGQAIAVTGAPVVDVSSGVERAPGVKDPELMRRFVAAAKAMASAA